MSEWKEYKLEDVIDKFIDYRGKTPKKNYFGCSTYDSKNCKKWKNTRTDRIYCL